MQLAAKKELYYLLRYWRNMFELVSVDMHNGTISLRIIGTLEFMVEGACALIIELK